MLVGSALAVVLSKNLFHSVLWLALALTGTAGIFLLLDAEFLAGVQILLYAGGVVTVVVFAIVVTERLVGTQLSHTSRHVDSRRAGGRRCFWRSSCRWLSKTPLPLEPVPVGGRSDAGHRRDRCSRTFVLPFELLAVLLLVALLGASYFARPEE